MGAQSTVNCQTPVSLEPSFFFSPSYHPPPPSFLSRQEEGKKSCAQLVEEEEEEGLKKKLRLNLRERHASAYARATLSRGRKKTRAHKLERAPTE